MIEVDKLSKSYGSLLALDNISFSISGGEVVGLLGPNGAGKSTTLRIITGSMAAGSGRIIIDDMIMAPENQTAIKSVIGYLPESAPLYDEMLVFDYLQFIAESRSVKDADISGRIGQMVDLCALGEVMAAPIATLSKGYRQRVGLAQALLSDPKILILDEPTSGLDPNQIIEIRQIIKNIGKEKTVIFSSHILSEVEATCDRVIIINRGKIVADDRSEMLHKGKSSVTDIELELSGADCRQAEKLLAGLPEVDSINCQSKGDTTLVTLKAGDDIRAVVYQAVKKSDYVLLAMRKEQKNLENVFHALTTDITDGEQRTGGVND